LAPEFEDQAEALALIRELLAADGTSGMVALRGGTVAGYLLGAPEVGSPTRPFAGMMLPRAASMSYEGHAVETGQEDAVYPWLYGALAPDWVASGLMGHYVTVSAEPAAMDAWVDLGFGRYTALGVRSTAAPDVRPASEIEVRRATVDDEESVQALMAELLRAFADAPVFVPYPPEVRTGGRELIAAHLSDPGSPFWLASVHGRPVSVMVFIEPTSPNWHQPKIESTRNGVYLFLASTLPEARGTGVGAALFAHAMAWAREAGYDDCTVNYFTASRAARFWQGVGFRPVTYWMRRILDDRIAWARG
jgi:GNAT superfamily N-acetyltransferase